MKSSTIAFVRPPVALATLYRTFLGTLVKAGFKGEIATGHAELTVLSTDNSIYQLLPQAAVYPRDAADVECLTRLVVQPEWRRVAIAPRGGGTGTNGQSLTDGIVVDLSRHMNGILEIDVERRQVRVQAGVVKDQLNLALKPHGLFFAPELSTSNRATIGGMVSTDASGQGSCTYGKTRNHVIALDFVLLGGERLHSAALDDAELARLCAQTGVVGDGYRVAETIQREKGALIEAIFPKLNRCLTGYDLAHLREDDGRFNLNSVLCGSEGSLGLLVEATLNVLPIPRYSILVNVRYAAFMDALLDAKTLMAHHPLSIETVDSKVLLLAMRDIVWHGVAEYFPQDLSRPTLGINLVEFSGDNELALSAIVAAFTEHLERDRTIERLGHTLAIGHAAVTRVYGMRKRSVGLLSNVEGEVRPQPFVEDTAVPPENLADYIADFRALLDSYGVAYGMFGHVDAGVLHVRPALDMKNPDHQALIRPISDAVAALTRRYGGVLWGEHGKGVRSEYSPVFFGELYESLQDLKAAFDPHNQLNPGKIATPSRSGATLLKINEVPMRGQLDRTIDERVWKSFGTAMHCNGNGACYNFDPDDAMCPSWKGTRDRVHSPKGRASLMREWLRLQGSAGINVLDVRRNTYSFFTGLPQRWRNSRAMHLNKSNAQSDFSHQVYDAMAGCLACKSCSGQCPVKVSVPEFRARFLELYHQRYLRPLKDYLIGSLEFTIPYFARMPAIYNAITDAGPVRNWLENHAGMVDSPLLSRFDFAKSVRRWNVLRATPERLAKLSNEEKLRSVIFVQDAFTRYFETPLAAAFIELAARLKFTVYLVPFRPNGKPLQVQGFLAAFDHTARKNAMQLSALAGFGVPLVGLDPAMTLVYRQEYRKVESAKDCPEVLLPQEWLIQSLPKSPLVVPPRIYRLMAHCTEKTNVPSSTTLWQNVFTRAGLHLMVEHSGCCGMSGTYGHETRNVKTSEVIFEQSWGPLVDGSKEKPELLATGYSCRSQVERFRRVRLRHPLEVILSALAISPSRLL